MDFPTLLVFACFHTFRGTVVSYVHLICFATNGEMYYLSMSLQGIKTSHGNSKDEVNRLSQLNMIHNQ